MTTATVTTDIPETLTAGDVIEHTDPATGHRESGLALLVSHDTNSIVLDRCDGTLPAAIRWHELTDPAVYNGH